MIEVFKRWWNKPADDLCSAMDFAFAAGAEAARKECRRQKIEEENEMDIVEQLRATPETGADPEIIFKAADEIEQLRDALRKVAQSHAWQLFGECRSFGEDVPLLTPKDADAMAHEILTPNA